MTFHHQFRDESWERCLVTLCHVTFPCYVLEGDGLEIMDPID